MNNRAMISFGSALEKNAKIGGSISRLLATHVRVPKTAKALGSKMVRIGDHYFPTFAGPGARQLYKSYAKNLAGGVTTAAYTGLAGVAGLGAYGAYKGITMPAPVEMSGY